MMLGIEFAPNIEGLPGDPAKATAVRIALLLHEAGLLTIPAGTQVLRLLPALNLTPSEAQEGLDIIESVCSKLTRRA
jgi:acetylornithine/succinyldiaminopimelate/putrescine aminotransferase